MRKVISTQEEMKKWLERHNYNKLSTQDRMLITYFQMGYIDKLVLVDKYIY